MNLYSDVAVLDAQLAVLTGKDDSERKGAAEKIKFHVEAAARELSLERFVNFENQLFEQIFTYVRGEHIGEKMGGILVIRELIDCTSAGAEAKVIKFANTLSAALNGNTDFALIALVAEALGHMARYSPVAHVDFVESELSRALEWLRVDPSRDLPHRRLAACAILEQLADNAPTIFFVRTSEFFDIIWGPLRDPKEPIRLAAAKALSACLAVLKQRTYHLQWYFNIYEQIHEGFRKNTPESIHGSLLVTSEMLLHTGDFMIPRFKEICTAIMKLKEHRSRTIRSAVTGLIPKLAEFSSDAFARSYLDESVDILVKFIKSSELRPQVLKAIGKLCQTAGSYLIHRVDELLAIVKEALASAKKSKEVLPEALICIADMVIGLGTPFHSRVLVLLDAMIAGGLNPELINTLSIIIEKMPEKRVIVQQRVLEEVTRVLGGDCRMHIPPPSYLSSWTRKSVASVGGVGSSHPGNPAGLMSPVKSAAVPAGGGGMTGFIGFNKGTPSTPVSSKSLAKSFSFARGKATPADTAAPATKINYASGINVAAMGLEVGVNYIPGPDTELAYPLPVTPDLIILCLRTLGNLHLPPFSLIAILQKSVISYLDSDNARVRKQAALTCSTMLSRFIRDPANMRLRGPTALAIEAMLVLLLELAVADPSQKVRLTVMQSFGTEFDVFLQRANHISVLMYLISDESLEIRIICLKIMGRLSLLNPAAVLPYLRQVLLQLISEIRNSEDNRSKEDAVVMLCNFMRSGPALQKLVQNFLGTLIRSLQVTSDVRLTTVKLEALGELSLVMGQEILPFVDELMPVIVSNMQDHSSKLKQERAVKTLGQLVSATGCVIRPYLEFPMVLPGALDTLYKNTAATNTAPWSFRREILRTLGLIGALEPHNYQLIKEYIQTKEKKRLNIEKTMSGAAGVAAQSITVDDPTNRGKLKTLTAVDTDHGLEGCLAGDGKPSCISKIILKEQSMASMPAHMFTYEQCTVRSYYTPKSGTGGEASMAADNMKDNPMSEDYCPRIAVSALMRILRDPSLVVHHSAVTQAIMMIFKGLGMKCVPLLEQIMPYLLQVVRQCGPGLRESILRQLSQLMAIVRHNMTPYFPLLFDIICEHWRPHLEHILSLVEEVALYSEDEFRTYLPRLLPLLQSSLSLKNINTLSFSSTATNTKSPMRSLERTLACHDTLRGVLKPYLHIVVPSICKLIAQLQELGAEATPWLLLSIRTLRRVFSNGSLLESQTHIAFKIVHCLTDVITYAGANQNGRTNSRDGQYSSSSAGLATGNTVEVHECVKTLCQLAHQLGPRFLVFDGLVRKCLKARGVQHNSYNDLINLIKVGQHEHSKAMSKAVAAADSAAKSGVDSDIFDALGPTGKEFWSRREGSTATLASKNSAAGLHTPMQPQQKLQSNQQHLMRSWDVSQRSTASDWKEWLSRFTVELLRESPSSSLRACSALAQAYPPLGKELFHAAFVSCWMELLDAYQDNLVKSLQQAFRSPTMPPEILQTLLNLAEFMEHDVGALPIPPQILAGLAEKSRAYAKALHYCELEFLSNPATCFESLININTQLDMHESALGVLKVVEYLRKKYPDLASQYVVRDSWLAKLGHFEAALARYEMRLQSNPKEAAGVAGKLKCLESLGRWEECIQICNDQFINNSVLEEQLTSLEQKMKSKSAIIGATAAWHLKQWDTMDALMTKVTSESVDAVFMRAALSAHREDFPQCRELIDSTRKLLDEQLSALLAESYNRAYTPLIMMQQCAELEEILEYKMFLKETGILAESVSLDISSGKEGSDSSTNLDCIGLSGVTNCSSNATGDEEATKQLYLEACKRKELIADKWRKRLKGCRATGRGAIPLWGKLMNVRRMILSDREDIDTWLEFAELCRNGENPHLAERVLNMEPGGMNHNYPESRYAPPLPPDAPVQGGGVFSVFGTIGGAPLEPSPFFNPTPAGVREPSPVLSSYNKFPVGTQSGQNPPPPLSPRRMPPTSSNAAPFMFSPRTPGMAPWGQGQGLLPPAVSGAPIGAPLKQSAIDRRLEFGILNQLWFGGQRGRAVEGLENLLQTFAIPSSSSGTISAINAKTQLDCLLALGHWKVMLLEKGGKYVVDKNTRKEVLGLYHRAIQVDATSYAAWHEWGLASFRAAEETKKKEAKYLSFGGNNSDSSPQVGSSFSSTNGAVGTTYVGHMVNAAKGLLRAISLGTKIQSASVMQDMLCFLSLWFRYVHVPELHATIAAGLSSVHIDSWLGVLPQLIARLDHPEEHGRLLLHELLLLLGTKHAQALVYPLTVALKSNSEERNRAAGEIMSALRAHHPKLIDQASMVSTELVRVAILWQETWHDSLEDASRQYFGEGNVQAMLDNLLAAHELMNLGPNTLKEMSFVKKYGQDLHDAYIALQNYKRVMDETGRPVPEYGAAPVPSRHSRKVQLSLEEGFLAQAWDLYYKVFKSINEQIVSLTSLELQYCSPLLSNATDLDLGVPGTYHINGTCVRIKSFNQVVPLIRSKQHPRKIKINGEDGNEYGFLLKGLEDLRQDERAMQLFGLVNALFSSDKRTANEDFSIRRYSVIPLSPTAGLLSWVPRCDTLHDVIRDFRDSRKILLNIEVKLMQQMAPNQLYDQLSLMQKLEVFEYALANTAGEDVAKVLWHRSETSEIWLEKRNNYTRSLAVMSMVGYILGLGDRHPSNLMLARSNGKIVHIDFGDCFEVAMHRDKFPEKVPFRLTRMLVNAMEVSGIEGSFRFTCEKVMSIMRENKDSLIATLEAFVHDPLISFRLLHHTSEKARKNNKKARPTEDKEERNNGNSCKVQKNEKAVAVAAASSSCNINTPVKGGGGGGGNDNNNSNGSGNASTVPATVADVNVRVASPAVPSVPVVSPPTSPTAVLPKSSNSKRSLPSLTLESVPEDRLQTGAGTEDDEDDFNMGAGLDTDVGAGVGSTAATVGGIGASANILPPMPPPLPDLNTTPGSAMRRSKKLPLASNEDSGEIVPTQLQQIPPPPPPLDEEGAENVNGYMDGDYENLEDGDGSNFAGLVIDEDDGAVMGANSDARIQSQEDADAIAEAEIENRRAPPEQSYKPNLHLDMINMAQSMVQSDGVTKISASYAQGRHLSGSAMGGQSHKSGKRGKVMPTQAQVRPHAVAGEAGMGSVGSDSTPAQYHEDFAGGRRRASNASVRSVLTISTFNEEQDHGHHQDEPGGTFEDDDDDASVQEQDDDELTSRAVFVIRRVMDKLAGFDFVDQAAMNLASDMSQSMSAEMSASPGNGSASKATAPYVHNATAITLSSVYVAPPVGNMNNQNNSSTGMAMTVRQPLVVKEQVDRIIRQAISNENLCQSFSGWCPFW